MASLEGFLLVVYFACVIAIIIYVLRLLGKFVSTHERIAGALETIARKLGDNTQS